MDFFKFKHVGKKIKLIVKWYCIIKILILWAIILAGLIITINNNYFYSLILIPIGIVFSFAIWIVSLLIYGFGDLIQTNNEIRNGIKNNGDIREETEILCPKCWKKVPANEDFCPHCNATLK